MTLSPEALTRLAQVTHSYKETQVPTLEESTVCLEPLGSLHPAGSGGTVLTQRGGDSIIPHLFPAAQNRTDEMSQFTC